MTISEYQIRVDVLFQERRILDDIHYDVLRHAILADDESRPAYFAISGELSALQLKLESQKQEILQELM